MNIQTILNLSKQQQDCLKNSLLPFGLGFYQLECFCF